MRSTQYDLNHFLDISFPRTEFAQGVSSERMRTLIAIQNLFNAKLLDKDAELKHADLSLWPEFKCFQEAITPLLLRMNLFDRIFTALRASDVHYKLIAFLFARSMENVWKDLDSITKEADIRSIPDCLWSFRRGLASNLDRFPDSEWYLKLIDGQKQTIDQAFENFRILRTLPFLEIHEQLQQIHENAYWRERTRTIKKQILKYQADWLNALPALGAIRKV